MKAIKTLFMVGLAILGLTVSSFAIANDYAEQKVVYHVNYKETSRHALTLGNVQNHINGVGNGRIQVQVIAHGAGVQLLRKAKDDPQMQARIDNLKLQGVEFKVCENTMRNNDIKIEQLYDVSDSDVVKSGVAEIAALQQQGYVYLRP